MTKIEPHVTEIKRKEVEDIKKLLNEYMVMAILNLEKLPAFNYMKIKTQLKGGAVIKYTKKRLMKIAFDESGDKGLAKLKDKLTGIPALLYTNHDPFKLFQILKKSKSPAAAEVGDIAPDDIIIQAGPTDFTPGPMIGELGALGMKTKVEGGKIHIREDKFLVAAGMEIDAKSAELMGKMKMEPMSIGLNLVATYQNGEILDRAILDIDLDKYFSNIKIAASESIALAIEVGYITLDTVELLIKKAVIGAKNLAKEGGFLVSENIGEKLALAEHNAKVTSKLIGDLPSEQFSEKEINRKNNESEVQSSHQEIKEKKEEEMKKSPAEINESFEKKALRSPGEVTDDDIRRAQEKLKELTDKKLRGEI